MADAKLMLNTVWGEFGHPTNMTGTWQRIETMRWQKTEAPLECWILVSSVVFGAGLSLEPVYQPWKHRKWKSWTSIS